MRQVVGRSTMLMIWICVCLVTVGRLPDCQVMTHYNELIEVIERDILSDRPLFVSDKDILYIRP